MLESKVGTRDDLLLRQATADQFDATFVIKKASGGAYIRDVFGWDEDIQIGFHQRQFSSQNTRLILLGGATVGWVSVFDHDDCTKIEELYVLPEFQKRGIGTAVLLEVIAHAKRRQVPLRLRVFKINDGARRLYERLGFRAGEEDGPFLYMTLVFQVLKESGAARPSSGSTMRYRNAAAADASELAQMNHQLIPDEGHRNRMSVNELEERMPLLVREVRPDDAEAILSILNPIIESGAYSALDTPLTVEAEQEFIHSFPQRGVFHVAEQSREPSVVGFQTVEPFATYTRAFDHVGVVATFVEMACRGRGVGRRLAEATFELARRKGYEKLFTFVRADNPNALGFYSRLGFRVVGTAESQARIGGKYVDEVIIEKFL
jgi:ribosomal protein S18 acetylase RimI-like enzyme